jgi:hypothetical protein
MATYFNNITVAVAALAAANMFNETQTYTYTSVQVTYHVLGRVFLHVKLVQFG